jgi:hypothetical protein
MLPHEYPRPNYDELGHHISVGQSGSAKLGLVSCIYGFDEIPLRSDGIGDSKLSYAWDLAIYSDRVPVNLLQEQKLELSPEPENAEQTRNAARKKSFIGRFVSAFTH